MAHGSLRATLVSRFDAGALDRAEDTLLVEEPLAIRLAGDTLAVTMRTPGNDRELVMGFLWSEGVIRTPRDVSGLSHCGRTGSEARENAMEVTLAPGVRVPVDERGSLPAEAH